MTPIPFKMPFFPIYHIKIIIVKKKPNTRTAFFWSPPLPTEKEIKKYKIHKNNNSHCKKETLTEVSWQKNKIVFGLRK